ncbi:MAG: hypothetical protein LUD72_07885 [Bacteroidales bacterium]|nr:hypothetical protein [Bacteroidales bacterium]
MKQLISDAFTVLLLIIVVVGVVCLAIHYPTAVLGTLVLLVICYSLAVKGESTYKKRKDLD